MGVRPSDCRTVGLMDYRNVTARYGVTFCFSLPPQRGKIKMGVKARRSPGCSRAYPLPDLPPKRGKAPVSIAPDLGVFSL